MDTDLDSSWIVEHARQVVEYFVHKFIPVSFETSNLNKNSLYKLIIIISMPNAYYRSRPAVCKSDTLKCNMVL